jgi:hypothetical protein
MVLDLYLTVQFAIKRYICMYPTYACQILHILQPLISKVHRRPYSAVKCTLILRADKGIHTRKGSSSNTQYALLEHSVTSTQSLGVLHIQDGVDHSIHMTPVKLLIPQ